MYEPGPGATGGVTWEEAECIGNEGVSPGIQQTEMERFYL